MLFYLFVIKPLDKVFSKYLIKKDGKMQLNLNLLLFYDTVFSKRVQAQECIVYTGISVIKQHYIS